jgi:biotin carboxylase
MVDVTDEIGRRTGRAVETRGLPNEAPRDERPLLLLINSGRDATYRGWTLRSISENFRVWLFSNRPAAWELPYIVGQSRVDVLDLDTALAVAQRLRAHCPIAGVVCYDEMRIVAAAQLAERLGLPTSPSSAIGACHDKARLRRRIGQVTAIAVTDVAGARAAADRIGYPVIIKPRALAASEGVIRIDRADQLDDGFLFAWVAHANFTALAATDRGVIVEEYLDGPEITVDSVVCRGEVRPAFISHKSQDLPPTFEETGHLVVADDPLLQDTALLGVVQEAHSAAGFDHGVTHTEVRLTASGPKLIELNARLGGDLVTYVGLLATGIDLASAAAYLAVGVAPDIKLRRRGVAAVRYLYPAQDMVLERIRVHTHLLWPEVSGLLT